MIRATISEQLLPSSTVTEYAPAVNEVKVPEENSEVKEESQAEYSFNFEKSGYMVKNSDFQKIDPLSSPWSDAEIIMLDPSCSGTGMQMQIFQDKSVFSQFKDFSQTEIETFESNLDKEMKRQTDYMHNQQVDLIKHALK